MNSSSQNPALPTWIFIATDLALIGAATAIALLSPRPLSTGAMLWIVGCVGVGAIIGLLPLVARYERQKNETLDERQQALEALALTISSSAEQISIATKGLHEIADLANKNLRVAEQLPHKLQDKIAEFQSQLSATTDTEKEELERELLALRTSESERLDSVSQRIAKSYAEWTKLEAATHQHLTAANEAVAKLALGTAGAIGKAQAAAEQALTQARVEAARALGEVSGNAARSIEAAKSSALAELDTRLAQASATLVERVIAGLNATLANAQRAPAHFPTSIASHDSTSYSPPGAVTETPSAERSVATPPPASPPTNEPEPAPKRARKPRHEEPATHGKAEAPAASGESHALAPLLAGKITEEAAPSSDEPHPIPAHTIPEVTPVAPATAEPFSGQIATIPDGSTPPVASESSNESTTPVASTDSTKPARKRSPKKVEADEEPALGLELDDTPPGMASGTQERVRTSDGATRLIVTAYIGIGNRLFIRGDGPGLSWEKGVPLQFVSIGKWRWETSDAAKRVTYKLYKNDDHECSALGAQSLDPAHQQEVTAAF